MLRRGVAAPALAAVGLLNIISIIIALADVACVFAQSQSSVGGERGRVVSCPG